MRGEPVLNDTTLAIPTDIVAVRDGILLIDIASDSVFHLWDPSQSSWQSFGKRGSGPVEFKSAWSLDVDIGHARKVWVYDIALNRLTLIDTRPADGGQRPTIVRSVNLTTVGQPTGPAWLSATTMVSNGFFSQGRLALFDSTCAQVGHVGEYPPGARSLPPSAFHSAYQGVLTPRPSRDHVAVATRFGTTVQIFNTVDYSAREVVGPFVFGPQVRKPFGGHASELDTGPRMRFGYVDLAASHEHIFALFSGRLRRAHPKSANYARFVHVFDWDGALVKVLKLDALVIAIAVDTGSTTLYAVRHHPTPAVLIFDLRVDFRTAEKIGAQLSGS